MTYQHIKLTQIGGAGGAQITGLRLDQNLDADTLREIQQALAQFLVVTFPDQALDDQALANFTRQLGQFGLEPFLEGELTHPNVVAVVKEADETRRMNFGGNWHSDWSFIETPPSFTLLHARELPPVGGDTLFANQYLAYETLSAGMQKLLDGLRAVHSARRSYGPQSPNAKEKRFRSMKIRTGEEAMAEFVHPCVRVHPQTGRKALYLNKVYTIRFEGMTEAESSGLLNFLTEHSVRHEFIVRVQWKPNMLTVWDNRTVQHLAVNDYDGHRREMHRTSVLGEKPQALPSVLA